MNDDIVRLVSVLGVLVLAGSALLHRGLTRWSALKLALIWLLVIGAAWGAVSLIQHGPGIVTEHP